MLGDGFIELSGRMLNGRFKLQLAEKHSGYAKMVLRILAPYCSSDQIKLNNYLDKRTDKTYYNCSFKTKALPTFTKLHKIWYKDNTKIIPANIKELLTPARNHNDFGGEAPKTTRYAGVFGYIFSSLDYARW